VFCCWVFRGVSFTVKRGEWVIIYGTSGGGKTTLLNILGTIDKPTKGNVWILGTDINEQTKDKQLAHLRLKQMYFGNHSSFMISSLLPSSQESNTYTCCMFLACFLHVACVCVFPRVCRGFVFQTFNLLSSLTAIENVMIPMVILGKLRKKERIARAESMNWNR
jgi:putative ABC transport system ATP-binding protein